MLTSAIQKRIEALPQATRERVAHIDFTLMFKGEAVRADLMTRFNMAPAQVTKDFMLYRELAPQNIAYDAKRRVHIRGAAFASLFEYDPLRTLATLSQGFGDGFSGKGLQPFACEAPHHLNQPALTIVAQLTEAIYRRCALRITYISLSSGETVRDIMPHTLVDNGLRWHVRAYDRTHGEFRDFVLTRIAQAQLLVEEKVREEERSGADTQWTTPVTLELKPHPARLHCEAIALDYAMTDGVRHVTVRAATAGYLLRRWNVDCSTDHHLNGPEYQLWLANPACLDAVSNASLAPGRD
ncbi:WYL domain-containing protein [Dickeya oryzae]|uniref:WYL domain-containing protein n=1 Tax=Dickeya oryzae TaxID=1240404 RepID=A0AB39I738_9GAMM|nr:WYL domain-containing protein [Dickeya oryzae]MCA6994873.1 WYL domain-containing protein [Dickeya oryzae]